MRDQQATAELMAAVLRLRPEAEIVESKFDADDGSYYAEVRWADGNTLPRPMDAADFGPWGSGEYNLWDDALQTLSQS